LIRKAAVSMGDISHAPEATVPNGMPCSS